MRLRKVLPFFLAAAVGLACSGAALGPGAAVAQGDQGAQGDLVAASPSELLLVQAEAEPTYRPVFRLHDGYGGKHFFSWAAAERNDLAPRGWTYEGVGWQAPSSGDDVYRLYSTRNGDHLFTTSAAERDAAVAAGWNYEGVAFYSSRESDEDRQPVFRLLDPGTGEHFFTANAAERDALVGRGWNDEGVGFYGRLADPGYADDMEKGSGLLSTWPSDGSVDYLPTYRMFKADVLDHLFSTSKAERNAIVSRLWHYEGVAWQSASAGNPVYRLYNSYTNEHLFTMSAVESGALSNSTWRYEGVAFYSPTADDESRIAVYRLYSPSDAVHFLTANPSERDDLLAAGWQDEGIGFYAHAADPSFADDMATWRADISGEVLLDTELGIILFYRDSLRSAYDYVSDFPYISGNTFTENPHFLDDGTTKSFAQEMLSNHGGNCYRYAALFCWLARGLGYDARVVSGWVPSYSGGRAPHGWVEIDIDGKTYIFDPDMAHANRGVDWYMRTYDNPPTNYGSW